MVEVCFIVFTSITIVPDIQKMSCSSFLLPMAYLFWYPKEKPVSVWESLCMVTVHTKYIST